MRYLFQRMGFLILFAGIAVWLIGGAKKGFYVTTEEFPIYDPIAQIEGTINQPKFLPGIEFLITGLIIGGSFCLTSFLFSKKV